MNAFDAYQAYVNPTLARLEKAAGISRNFVRAEGCTLWDDGDREYLDFGAGHGAFNLGHNDGALIESLAGIVAGKPLQIYSVGPSPHMGALARKLAEKMGSPCEIAFFTNSGTEAVEGALKIARAATGRSKVVYCTGAYHGTTLGSLSLMAAGPLRDGFEPLMPDFISIPFDDVPSLREALKSNDVAAFVVEPIPCEGGVHIPSASYLRDVVQLCREAGTLSVFDEIQTGLGRTGGLLACDHWDARPDVVTLGKAFGGGLLPIGAYVTSRKIQDRAYGTFRNCAVHHSSFGGNSLSCQVALRTLERLADGSFLAQTREKGHAFLQLLRRLYSGHTLVREIRGLGLLIGVEFHLPDHPWLWWENMGLPEFKGLNSVPYLVMKELLGQGIITHVCAHDWNVLKIEPPLIITLDQMARFGECLGKAIDGIKAKVE